MEKVVEKWIIIFTLKKQIIILNISYAIEKCFYCS